MVTGFIYVFDAKMPQASLRCPKTAGQKDEG
jgi:hypothetical protein